MLNLLEQDGYLSMHGMSEILSVNEKTVEREYAKLKAGGYIRKEGKTKDASRIVIKH